MKWGEIVESLRNRKRQYDGGQIDKLRKKGERTGTMWDKRAEEL